MDDITNTTPIDLEEVYILSRETAIRFRCERPWACISIATEATDFAEISKAHRIDLLQITFVDLEQPPSRVTLEIYPALENVLFTELHAERILDFADRITGRISVLMVHCALGQSRSPAVTASLLGIEPRRLEGASPNQLVYSLLEGAKRERHGWNGLRCRADGRIFGSELVDCESRIPGELASHWRVSTAEIKGDPPGDD